MAEGKDHADPRVDWIEARVRNAYRHLKADKFDKGWKDTAMQEKVEGFVDEKDVRVLVIFSDAMTPSHSMPKKLPKGKVLYFLKSRAETVDKANPGALITFHDMSSDPLTHLEKLVREVYLPLLTNPGNQRGWGEVASKEVTDKLYSFLANLSITVGHTKGETTLPLPPIDSGAAAATLSAKDKVHLLEGAVITWTKQIKNVLRQDPESALKNGKHPTPDVEIAFWRTKAANLNAIYDQLQSERIRRVLQFLDESRSTYCTPFAKLCREVFAARAEANDNVKFLRTLEDWFTRLNNSTDFEKLDQLFRPILHILLLIWKNSRYYNTPARLVVLIREVCNAIIQQAFGFVNGRAVFDSIEADEESEAIKKLKRTLAVCGAFKDVYADYKQTANTECERNPWRIQNNALFLRLDAFIERCHDVLEMTEIVVKFKKLERVVIGGTKGKALTRNIEGIFRDFKATVARFQAVAYDVMDIEVSAFDDDYYAFRSGIKELERRLGSVLTHGFEDQGTIIGRFKILESFDTLLERPIIRDELERKHIALVQQYGADLKRVQEIFLTERDDPPIPHNMPPIAGALTWCRALKERIMLPMAKIRELGRAIMEREEAKEVAKVYATIMASLDDFEHAKIEEWGSDMEASSESKLRLPLLSRGGADASDGLEEHLLRVNFDAALVRLLREVKYFLLLDLEVPASALNIYKSAVTFRGWTGALDLVVSQYNQIMTEMLPVEAPLLRQDLNRIDQTLKRGLKELNWKSPGIDPFIKEVQALVSKSHTTLFDLKRNLDHIAEILKNWASEPLLQRKPKPMTPDEFENMYRTMRAARYSTIKQQGAEIEKKLKESSNLMSLSSRNAAWVAYTDFVNSIVVQGLAKLVRVSLEYLAEQIDAEFIRRHGLQPMLVLDLNLVDRRIRFFPDITEDIGASALLTGGSAGAAGGGGGGGAAAPAAGGAGSGGGAGGGGSAAAAALAMSSSSSSSSSSASSSSALAAPPSGPSIFTIAGAWVESFYQAAAQVKRLDHGEGKYVKEMMGDMSVQMLLAVINERLLESAERCEALRGQYQQYQWLWTTDMHESFARFRDDAIVEINPREALRRAAAESGRREEDAEGKDDGDAEDERAQLLRIPDLDRFDREIERFEAIHQEVSRMQSPIDLGWLRVSTEPLKGAIQTCLRQWTQCFTRHLENFVVSELRDLQAFIARVNGGLDHPIPIDESGRADTEALMQVMGYIRDVNKCVLQRKAMFAPLKRAVTLLKHHGVPVEDLTVSGGEKVVDYIEEAPIKWDDTKTKTFQKKEEIFPLQTAETVAVKERVERFFLRVRDFRNEFRRQAPFNFDGPVDEAYAQLDAYVRRLEALEREAAAMNELEDLFELPISRFNEFAETRKELRLLKTLWDMLAMVTATYEDWEQTLWSAVNTDDLEDRNKKMRDYLKRLGDRDQIIKAWGVYKNIEQRMKAMTDTLPLINALHSEFMRKRHWDTLAGICGVRMLDPTDPNFSLETVFKLELHRHANDVNDVVETATNQAKIEKKLNKIEENWRVTNLAFAQHKETEVKLLRLSEELLELLEGDQLELQSVKGMGKFAEFFSDRIERWDHNLSELDDVLKVWSSVTKAWTDLEVIFMESEDIQLSLPEDTKRFSGIDTEFKELMKTAMETPNAIESCTKEGRKDSLKGMMQGLEQCQKSLKDYLDMKKKKFPRFYFMSAESLLTTLSNGSNPPKVVPKLRDCYDSLAELTFEPPAVEGGIPNVATEMIAKDGERIRFYDRFIIEGAVETWLNALTRMQQDTLRNILLEAQETAVNWEVETEKPRHIWLEDYPAQIVLVATQIFWTEETQRALEELEGGQEDAVKKYLQVCNDRLNALINRVLGDLDEALRTKIIALITLDVHARDVVQKLIDTKADGPMNFMWQQQLRFYWEQDTKDVNIAITDFRSKYSYEWVGNTARLVITPLTDRCYITLTLALRLMLGGAPAGPAGTGKTETTKDLARALALPCYVFNCSDQMNYQGLADIFKGLAQTGAWGCFDEFNRITIEVLSVVATQVKSILDAVKLFSVPANRPPEFQGAPAGSPPTVLGYFELSGDPVTLVGTVGAFITMNPGYAGRTELPENLKALFRSCAMIRPDLALICENMLMSEGFQNARPLSIKMVTLYQLSSELLSPQVHYDWGLRSVKSVLRVAGGLKRAEPDVNEDAILMRALRDFNTPKMPHADLPIFRRLIQDLFPSHYTLAPKFDSRVEAGASTACREAGLQPDPDFVKRVVQYQELLNVRHSVMLLGIAGCGKTTIWKMLAAHHNLGQTQKRVAVYDVVNPKAVTSNELYGYMTLSKDWHDGCLSVIMRGMSSNNFELGYYPHQTIKWVVLDGDIDAEWIESMNTVMDDNKILTLVSNERVPLTAAMRMIFEIDSLANASPATVSRAGILYINETDVGWRPFVDSWIQRRTRDNERAHLPGFFDKYVDKLADSMRRAYVTATPILLINQAMSVCRFLESFLEDLPEHSPAEVLEQVFVHALIWSFGGGLIVEKQAGVAGDHRKNFHTLLQEVCGPAVKFPKSIAGSEDVLCFDFFYNAESNEWEPWVNRVEPYVPVRIGDGPEDAAFSSLVVQTVDSVRISGMMDRLVRCGHPVMMVGTAGTGKTTLVKSYLKTLPDEFLNTIINLNYFTDSKALQAQIDRTIDKRSGKIYGPPTGKTLILFMDDLNLPYVEKYGTQNSLELLRQIVDHRQYYDREDPKLRKEVVDVQFIAAMNPTAGSFRVNARLQRFFTVFSCLMPSASDLRMIYQEILAGHLRNFPPAARDLAPAIANATIALHDRVAVTFLPSAKSFMYNWNMRELANVFQGLCNARSDYYPTALKVVRLWVHECFRVFSDRMVVEEEASAFRDMLRATQVEYFKDLKADDVFAAPLLFTWFVGQPGGGESFYLPVPEGERGQKMLADTLADKLLDYQESVSVMDLVLFDQAVEHICRIARIIRSPGGHAMLVGVGGSGKQSLSRLAAFICGFETVQLSVTSRFTVNDLKERLQAMYRDAGEKNKGQIFLLTDSQIVNEEFLVYINEMLTSGWIPNLFEREDLEKMLNANTVRNDAKAVGLGDTLDNLFEFFLMRTRRNLHLVLCFSPVGESFRVRARRFPGIINCTSNDRFHPWPRDALVSVAKRFLEKVELDSEALRLAVAEHMAEVHSIVTEKSVAYLEQQRRYNYVTPKSFLELIGFYSYLLRDKRAESERNVKRLDDGLSKLLQTAQDVAELQVDLEHKMVVVHEKVEATEALLRQVAKERGEAEVQEREASEVARVAGEETAKAAEIQARADGELEAARPAKEKAERALERLDPNSLKILKALGSPPEAVQEVTAAVAILVNGEKKDLSWKMSQRMMANPAAFIERLKEFGRTDVKNIPDDVLARVQPYLDKEYFNGEDIKSKSEAAASLCEFVVNCVKFNRIYVVVKPLEDSAAAARITAESAKRDQQNAEAIVEAARARVRELEELLATKVAEKEAVEAEAAACQARLALANRLVNGLSSEKDRWGASVASMRAAEQKLVGDVLLASAFVSYLGAFDFSFREMMWKGMWLSDMRSRSIPLSDDVDPLALLVSEADTAKMMNEGLPADRISVENGAVITSSKRWPLMIDPQLQGIKWLKRREEPRGVVIIQLSQNKWINSLRSCITNGTPCIIENCDQELDATLDPVLSRTVVSKGGSSLYMNVGGEETQYDTKFRLYLQTKLSNPHFRPEIQAQCTIINFIATEEGLKDQLLAKVVDKEKPELEVRKQELQAAFNRYKMELLALEDDLLTRLANAPEDILSDVPLIEGLEATKRASTEINAAVEDGKRTEVEINRARQVYVPVAEEGAMLFFMISQLSAIQHMYQYSLDQFMLYFFKAIREAPRNDRLETRVANLRDTLREVVYTWVSRGLFEDHKLVLLSQLTFQLMARRRIEAEFDPILFRFLLLPDKKLGEAMPSEVAQWLPESSWNSVQALASMDGSEFAKLPSDIEEASGRFREWFNHVTPEVEKLPLDWSSLDKTPFKKLLVLRCMRPDRLTVAMRQFVAATLPNGRAFTECDATLNALQILDQTLKDSLPITPIYFILSPGADVVSDLDQLAQMYGMEKGVSYHNVSMGQGQDRTAEEKLQLAHKQGHWVILNNVHLMPRWLVRLEKMLDAFATDNGGAGSHENFRVFLTSDPADSIPIGILNRSIKLTNEPPAGLKANLKRAFCSFKPEYINEIDSKMRAILFGLCHFHAVMIERKKFGSKGFNMSYPFSLGDLRDSAICLQNYMENASSKIPWEDLRYVIGQIMYGGHIVNDFDRLLCSTYLDHFLRDELLDEMELFPFNKEEKDATFMSPSPTTYDRYLEHIEEGLKGDTPIAFGLHPNAEVGFRTDQSDKLFRLLVELQPRDSKAGEGEKSPREEAKTQLAEMLETFGEIRYDLDDIGSTIDDAGGRGPFQNVLMLELEQMNRLLVEIKRSLEELELGFSGRLTMSDAMDRLEEALIFKRVPATWSRLAWPSLRPLNDWKLNLYQRISQLNDWAANPSEILRVTWLSGLINPQSFLTAIRQQTAQRNSLELDKLLIQTDVLKKFTEEIEGVSPDGAYIHGLFMQGARWEVATSLIEKSRPREMSCLMPVINCRSIPADKAEEKGIFFCPVYKTEQRGPTYVFSAQLKTKSPPARWIMAGVALIMDIVV